MEIPVIVPIALGLISIFLFVPIVWDMEKGILDSRFLIEVFYCLFVAAGLVAMVASKEASLWLVIPYGVETIVFGIETLISDGTFEKPHNEQQDECALLTLFPLVSTIVGLIYLFHLFM